MATISEFIDTNAQLKKQAAWSDMLPDWAYAATGGDPLNRVDLLKDTPDTSYKNNYSNKQQAMTANIFGDVPDILDIHSKEWNNDRTTPEDLWTVSNSIADNPYLATGATYNLMKMPEGRREQSALIKSFRSTANLLREHGKKEQADKLDESINALTTQIGSLGQTWLSPGQISTHVRQKMRDAMNALRSDPTVSEVLGDRLTKWDDAYKKRSSTPEYKKAINAYVHNYLVPNVYSKSSEQSLNGYLQDPAIAEALKYLTPLLASGVPIATVASLFGNNSLWLPLLLAGTGAAGYGYAKNKGYLSGITDSSIGRFIDIAANRGNNMIQRGMNYIAPDARPITDNIFKTMRNAPRNGAPQRYLHNNQKIV